MIDKTIRRIASSGILRKYLAEASKKVTYEGREYYLLGHFGAAQSTFNNIDLERPLFYTTNRAFAQKIGKVRATANNPATTAQIIATRLPSEGDHDEAWYEGSYRPLSKDFLKEAGVKLVNLEEVTVENREGIKGLLGRGLNNLIAVFRPLMNLRSQISYSKA